MRKPLSLILCFLVPALILLLGLLGAGVYGFRMIPRLFEETGRGVLPEGFQVEVPKPGKYTLWLYARGQYGGNFYRSAEKLPPGGKVYLFEEASGREIPITKWVAATKNFGHERAVSLGTFLTRREGEVVEVKGTGFSRPVLVSIAPTNTNQVLRVVFTLIAIVVLTLTVAIFAFLLLIHRYKTLVESSLEPEGRGSAFEPD